MGISAKRQPQGLARLNATNSLTKGALAVVSGAIDINVVSGIRLGSAGSGRTKRVLPQGIAASFRNNFYLETEVLPAIGTQSFVEFWYGIPIALRPAAGATEAAFLTGSNTNQNGISITDRSGSAGWAAISAWSSFNTTSDALVLGKIACLVTVRRQSGMELWHDGVLIQTFTQSPVSYPAESLIIGSFIEDTGYWTSSNDTILAGRVLNEWTADQVRSFSANPWQLFDAPSQQQFPKAAAAAGAVTGTLAVTEGGDTASSSGGVLVSGSVAATEGADTVSASGGVLISGTVAATESSDTLASAGAVSASGVTGSVAASESPDTVSASGGVLVSGSVSATEGSDQIASSGGVQVSGSLAASESPDTIAANGTVASGNTGTVIATEAADTISASGGVAISGAMAAVEAPDTLVATGSGGISGALAVIEGSDVLAAAGALLFLISGSANLVEPADTLMSAGTVTIVTGNVMTQPLDIIRGAMLSIGALASGDVLDPVAANDAFMLLNDMLDQWSNDSLLIYNTQEIIQSIGGGGTDWTIGNGGQINVVKPLNIDTAFVRVNTIDYPVQIFTLEQYEAIGLKQMSGPRPKILYYNAGSPLGLVRFWPNPTQGEIHMFANQVFTSFVTINDTISMPQGYNLAMRWSLAALMLPEYGKTNAVAIKMIMDNAKKCVGNLKSTNAQPSQVARFDVPLTSSRRVDSSWIYSGGF